MTLVSSGVSTQPVDHHSELSDVVIAGGCRVGCSTGEKLTSWRGGPPMYR